MAAVCQAAEAEQIEARRLALAAPAWPNDHTFNLSPAESAV
jgi:hypothetical protein